MVAFKVIIQTYKGYLISGLSSRLGTQLYVREDNQKYRNTGSSPLSDHNLQLTTNYWTVCYALCLYARAVLWGVSSGVFEYWALLHTPKNCIPDFNICSEVCLWLFFKCNSCQINAATNPQVTVISKIT